MRVIECSHPDAMPADERGFTLVEVLVALLLSTIVLAMIFATVLDASHEATRHSQRTKAQRATTRAFEMLANDLRAAQAPQRSAEYTNGPDGLRRILLTGEHASYEAHDILVATPSRLVFFMEADNSNHGAPPPTDIECVEWVVVASGALHRRVYPYSARCAAASNGAGAVMDHEVMPVPDATARGSADSKIPDPFSYELTFQPMAVMSAVLFPSCVNQTTASPTSMRQLDSIVTVVLDMRSFVSYRGARGDQILRSEIAITSRQSNEYRYGIGCSA